MTKVSIIICVIALFMLLNNLLAPFWFSLRAFFARKKKKTVAKISRVSVVIPVYNEESFIVKRMRNLREAILESGCQVEVLIGSDGSTDKTVAVVNNYIEQEGLNDWHILDFENEGKGRTVNKLVEKAQGELIVSTDADVAMNSDAISLIVKRFEEDDRLGCLSSSPAFVHKEKNTQSFYWSIEMKIRDAESRMGSLIVVTGWLYAFRKSIYKNIPDTAMADDLWVPLTVLLQDHRCSHDLALQAHSEKTDEQTEVNRRRRVISGGVDIVRRLMGPLLKRPGLFLTVFLHKINRWLMPLWLIVFGIFSLFIDVRLLFIYGISTVLLGLLLTPKRLILLIKSVFTPFFAFFSMARSKDLSKWKHTRI